MASWCARAVTTTEWLLLRRLGAHPRAAQSRATASVVRLGGCVNGDERRAAWTSRREGRRQTDASRLRQGMAEGCSRITRVQGTQRDCDKVKMQWCRFSESSDELWDFKSGTKGASRSPRKD
uniref:Uncharacterized protein n=1 Tax=Oryza meridionalis TaxID=40149 RepID=A0A0E0DMY5_9ORYZ